MTVDSYHAQIRASIINGAELLMLTPVPSPKQHGRYFFTSQMEHAYVHARYFLACLRVVNARKFELEQPRPRVNDGDEAKWHSNFMAGMVRGKTPRSFWLCLNDPTEMPEDGTIPPSGECRALRDPHCLCEPNAVLPRYAAQKDAEHDYDLAHRAWWQELRPRFPGIRLELAEGVEVPVGEKILRLDTEEALNALA